MTMRIFHTAELQQALLLGELRPFDLRPYDIDAVVFAAPCTAKHSSVNASGWIEPRIVEHDGLHRIGLAVRLAMDRCFLGTADGFLILDDPLVDMDPDRQAAAAKVIGEFVRKPPDHTLYLLPRPRRASGGASGETGHC